MKKPSSDRGFSIPELLIVICVIVICAAIAIPSLKRVEVSRVNKEFERYFGLPVLAFTDKQSGKPDQLLEPDQKKILRPFVLLRLDELCRTSADERSALDQRRTLLLNGPSAESASDAAQKLKELAELDVGLELLQGHDGSTSACSRARAVAGELGLLLEDK